MLNLHNDFQWLKGVLMVALGEEHFFDVIAGIFLFGVIGKCIVWKNYKRLIKGAETINRADHLVLRQIKMRVDSIRSVNGVIVSPDILIDRQLNRYRIFKIPINTLDEFVHWCTTSILACSIVSFAMGNEISNMTVGGGVALVLEWTALSIGTVRLREELKTILIDYVENNSVEKKRVSKEALSQVKITDPDNGKQEKEVILNQVIGEYLQ